MATLVLTVTPRDLLGGAEKGSSSPGANGGRFLPRRWLTCVSLVVADEALGEEPDHQGCGAERKGEA